MDTWKEDAYTCPSFSSYSSDRLAETAVRVAGGCPSDAVRIRSTEEDDFEFALVRDESEIWEGELPGGGKTGTVFPVFDQDLLICPGDGIDSESEEKHPESIIGIPLRKLFAEEDENPASCSSSEAGEQENIPADTYCVWRPKPSHPTPPSGWKKSSSTGSASKRWRLLDLLRSNSEGKDSFVFLTPKNRIETPPVVDMPGKVKRSGSRSAHEAFYVQNRAITEGNKKKSYLPYRRDLVGVFVSTNGFGKNFPRF